MSTNYRIQTVKDLYLDIVSVTVGHRSSQRYVLADVYQCALSAESFFPKKPLSLVPNMPANLRRKVDNSCPSCANSDYMDSIVAQAKTTLKEWSRELKIWLEKNGVSFDSDYEIKKVPVSDLDTNLDIIKC